MNVIEVIQSEIKTLFSNDASGHDYQHSLRVYKTAMKIAETESCDRELVAVAALLHDADDVKLFDTKHHANAREIMQKAGISSEMAEQAVQIIRQVPYVGTDSITPSTIEGKIVQDADRLDALGAIGIARTFAYGGAHGIPIYVPNMDPRTDLDKQAYRAAQASAYNHFFEKLLHLKDLMNTEQGRKMAEKRDEFLKQYIAEFDREVGKGKKRKKNKNTIELIKRDGEPLYYSHTSQRNLIRTDAEMVLFPMSDEEIEAAELRYEQELRNCGENPVTYETWRECFRKAMAEYPEVCDAYLSAHKKENAQYFEEICKEASRISESGDKSSGSVDSSLCSSKRALLIEAVEKVIYRNYHLTDAQKEAVTDGYLYVHDMGHRRDSINCCLFDMERVLSGGFEMGEMWYEEPRTLAEAFDVIGNVSINAAAQIYGGFTIPQIDELLVPYACKSIEQNTARLLAHGVPKETAERIANESLAEDFKNGFFALEEKFNSLISPRGDYPFITITFGIGQHPYAVMASEAAIAVRRAGHGAEGHKRPVLFPKLVFLYDKDLHGKGKVLYPLFQKAIAASAEVMYPEYLSLTGEKGIVSEAYRKYGKVISPMCCRAFLSHWFERGGEQPADASDAAVYVGRFSFGVISLNLPMILAKSRAEQTNFYAELDTYLELARQIHKATRRFLAKKKAHTNPLCFMQGGLYGGTLGRDDTIEPLLESATASFGFTALNELQRLYNGKSIREDGAFALEVLQYINRKAAEFQKEDHILYTVYGTPAESLCGKQVKSFRAKYDIVPNVSDKQYFSNSFHCHVSEDITPITKQNLEARFWEYANGGKIQYIRFTTPYNTEALETIVTHAMELGLYEGINLSLVYCNDCGHSWQNTEKGHPKQCAVCQSESLTMIERMCGYIAFTRIHGDTRLNEAKMAEIGDRVSM